MNKRLLAIVLSVEISACAFQPQINSHSSQYPVLSGSDYAELEKLLTPDQLPNRDERAIRELLQRVRTKRPVTWDEANALNGLVSKIHARREAVAAEQRTKEQEAQERKEQLAKEDSEHRLQAIARKEDERKKRYQYDFDSIGSIEDAKRFVATYKGPDEPGNLTSKAMKRGVTEGIANAQRCIDYSNRVIQRQKEIGAEVGYVDKAALYQAGASLVACRKQLAQYKTAARE